jgi:CDP-2,3-bis-(O-geranylgeranyl)-sn-glycerol synthase
LEHADGRGAGKTWRGLAGGAVLGGLTALAVSAIAPHWSFMDGWDYGASGSLPGESCTDCAPMAFAGLRVFLFGAGVGAFALIGDAVKSYFKRRRGKEGGAPWVPFDQLDFVVFGLAGMLLLSPLLLAGWVWAALTQDWVIPATLFLLTPVLHVAVNGLGYLLGLKKVPW